MRIVGGKFAGRDLMSPPDARVRPTAELVRAGLLDMLAADVKNAANRFKLVTGHGASPHALRANIATLRMRERTRVFKRDAIPFSAALKPDSYDIAFADPPYGSRMLDMVLDSWRSGRFARVLAIEHASTHDVPAGERRRTFDDTVVTIYRL